MFFLNSATKNILFGRHDLDGVTRGVLPANDATGLMGVKYGHARGGGTSLKTCMVCEADSANCQGRINHSGAP